jgi:hypothetical protein
MTPRRQQIGFTLAAVLWLAGVVYTVASGEYAEQSAFRNVMDLALVVISLWLLWAVWGPPADRTPPVA